MSDTSGYSPWLKRSIDIVGASVGLLVLGVPLLVAMLAVRVIDGAPVFFRQVRTGRGAQLFTLVKLRTLKVSQRVNDTDAGRLTTLGRLIRRSSIDEVPQFVNVLRGDMSLVGPRPLLPEYLAHYSPQQARRHEVRPGITGWAQIHGRNTLSWHERFELDVWYVDHRSLILDLRILFRTIGIVVRREGITQDGNASMEPFRGGHG